MIISQSQNPVPIINNCIESSQPFVIPTETVYGLAASIYDMTAIKRIFEYKKRPFFDPLIVHISSHNNAKQLTDYNSPLYTKLAEVFWPGPLTLVLPKKQIISDLITSGLDTVGIRMPNHPMALKLISFSNAPLAAPSANLFGQTSPTNAIDVEVDFPFLHIFDGGSCNIGIESTVLRIQKLPDGSEELSLLRPGFIKKSEIDQILKKNHFNYSWAKNIIKSHSPGHIKHHYMPKKPIIFLESENIEIKKIWDSIVKDFENSPETVDGVTIVKPQKITSYQELIFSDDPILASRELYSTLRDFSKGPDDILVFKKRSYMNTEAWEAFLERLSKASSLKYS